MRVETPCTEEEWVAVALLYLRRKIDTPTFEQLDTAYRESTRQVFQSSGESSRLRRLHQTLLSEEPLK
jgi:hypothetical protein